jgi:signal transduction histidine kinase
MTFPGLDYKDYPILFVDDEDLALETVRNQFKRHFTVHLAHSGEEALNLLKQNPVAVVIADQRMPRMNGVELLQRVRQDHPETVRMLITAYTDMEVVVEAINAGNVYRYISKPYNEDELRHAIQDGIEKVYLLKERERLYQEQVETMRRLSRANRLTAVGTLAASLAHEINNPLTAITTFLQMLPEKLQDPERDRHYFEQFHKVVLEETGRIHRLVVQLLRFSKTPEMEELNLETTDLNEVIRDMATLLETEAQRKGLEFRLELASDLPNGRLDPERIKQVVLNLTLNAIQATKDGHVLIRSCIMKDDHGRPAIGFSVVDTGPGIPKEIQEHLFSPFFSTRAEEGTGLGLITSRRIVERHHGTITVQSEPGHGAAFTVCLPLDTLE